MAPESSQRIPRLYVVTDQQQTANRPLAEVIAAATRGGAGMVQLREKDLSAHELYALGVDIKEVLEPHNIPLLINDRLDVAQALDAAGVHLAGHSLPTGPAQLMKQTGSPIPNGGGGNNQGSPKSSQLKLPQNTNEGI